MTIQQKRLAKKLIKQRKQEHKTGFITPTIYDLINRLVTIETLLIKLTHDKTTTP